MRRITRLAVAVAAMTAAIVFTPAPASASLTLVSCAGTTTLEHDPGLTNTVATVHQSGYESASCVSLLQPLTPLSFTAEFEGDITASCNTLFAPGSGTETFEWNTNETSVWSWTIISATSGNGTLLSVVAGPIITGKFAGTNVTQVAAFPNTDLEACANPGGMTLTNGFATWQFTS